MESKLGSTDQSSQLNSGGPVKPAEQGSTDQSSQLNSGAEVRELRMSYGKFHVSLLYKCIAHI